jgi:hypothetical protein
VDPSDLLTYNSFPHLVGRFGYRSDFGPPCAKERFDLVNVGHTTGQNVVKDFLYRTACRTGCSSHSNQQRW